MLAPQPFNRRATRRPMLQSMRQRQRQENPVTVVGGSGTVQGGQQMSSPQFQPNQNWWYWQPWWGTWGWGWGQPYSSYYYGWPQWSYSYPYGYDYCAVNPWAWDCQYRYPWSGGYGWGW